MEHEKLNLNSHNLNKESGRNKKRGEIQALNVEGKKNH